MYIFFYGHNPARNNYACFSNWFPSPFVKDGIAFNNTEQYMMYHKAMLMGDIDTAQLIKNETNPKKIKSLGRKVSPWNEKLWVDNRERIMYEGCLTKFSSDRNLRNVLLQTYPSVLVEASPTDKIWGIGMRSTDTSINNPENWKGLNLLGKTLVKVRDVLLIK